MRLSPPAAFAAFHFALLVLIQLENFFLSLLPSQSRLPNALSFLGTLPLLQAENMLAAAGLGFLAAVCARRRVGRWLFFAGFALLTAAILLDQLLYPIFFDHFRPSAAEGMRAADSLLGLSSLRNELTPVFAFNAVLALGALTVLARGWLGRAASELPPAPTPAFLAYGFPALLIAGLPAAFSSRYHNLQHHPLFGLVQEAFLPRPGALPAVARDGDPAAAAPTLFDSRPSVAPALAAARDDFRRAVPRPNVVLIVLESVGALQLLDPDGRPDPAIAPHLAQLFARGGVSFENFYSPFPGTVRTHVAMQTGGRLPTDGSVFELLPLPYTGPLLAPTFGAAGWRTGLFSSLRLDGEAMHLFFRGAGYDTRQDFADDPARHDPTFRISSWGAKEEHTLARVDAWLEPGAAAPFLLTWFTAATHHPYNVPRDYPAPFRGTDAFSRYRNALHYTDAMIGRLVAELARRGQLASTLFAITGDHGQAFGDRHARNFTHKHFLYEENIRSFLLLAHPALGGPHRSQRVATTGDLFPTLVGATGLPAVAVPGLDLLARDFPARGVHFHKNAYPEQWGLRDGRWKFIARLRDGAPELYDLSQDPAEQRNLAPQHAAQVRAYEAACRRWYLETDATFSARLSGFRALGGTALTAAELRTPGPKRGEIGTIAATDASFVPQNPLPATTRPALRVRWVSYPQDTPLDLVWRAPSGREERVPVLMSRDWSLTTHAYPGAVPVEPGTWSVVIRQGEVGLLQTTFLVEPAGE